MRCTPKTHWTTTTSEALDGFTVVFVGVAILGTSYWEIQTGESVWENTVEWAWGKAQDFADWLWGLVNG